MTEADIVKSTTCNSDGSQFTIQWSPPTNNSEHITQYELTVVAESDVCLSKSDKLLCNVVTTSTTTTTTITGLQCDTNFMVSVRAVNCASQKGNSSQFVMFGKKKSTIFHEQLLHFCDRQHKYNTKHVPVQFFL